MDKEPLVWETYEYEHSEKTPDWFWAFGIVVVTGVIASYLLGNILFAVLIAIGGFTMALLASRHPDEWTCELSSRGLKINNTLYPFSTLESFWVEDDGVTGKIILKSKKTIMPELIIPLEDLDPGYIREFLSTYLEEEEMHEPLSHIIMERLGF